MNKCPDCGYILACDKCSFDFSRVDEFIIQARNRENLTVQDFLDYIKNY